MFRAGILLSFASLALALSSGDLKVSVNAVSSKVSSIEDIVINTVVTNPTDSDIRVISKSNILDDGVTSSFVVTKDEKKVIFTGARVAYDLTHDSAYTTIPAGQSIALNHTVANLYDFESHGTGTFTFTPKATFQTAPGSESFIVEADAVKIEVTNDVAQRHIHRRDLNERSAQLSSINCGDGNRANVLNNALAGARAMAGGAATDIRNHPNSDAFNRYFGGNSQDDIWYRLDIIAGDLASSGTRQIYCNQDVANLCGPNSGVIAYTMVVTSGGNIVGSDIYTCDYYFNNVGSDGAICGSTVDNLPWSLSGILVHELSHATSGTDDIIYGCNNDRNLSAQDKRNNADNYQCMGLHIYRQYRC